MAKWTKRRRKAAAQKGWRTRRRKFLKRSKAAKKGWKRRKAKAAIRERAKAQPKTKRGPLKEWAVTWSYHPSKGRPRSVDFIVIARTKADALLYVVKAAAKGEDSTGADLTWLTNIPWDETSATQIDAEEFDDALSKAEIKKLGEGYVEIR